MARSTRWLRVALVAAIAALVVGRWLAVRMEGDLWAEALGVAHAHGAIANLELALAAFAFVVAAMWCTGNLYLVYRSIGSVQVPRRLGNLEIVETIPRRYLLYGAVGVGLILAFAMSHGADEWWATRALADAGAAVGVQDPVLGRDVGYYLFQLPWLRTLHGFVLLLTGVMLAITVFLYAAMGAIRWTRSSSIVVADLARTHVGVLLVTFALALYWGYRLEPAEYVAGTHNVPYDTILTDVRIPAARVLSGAALVVAGVSAVWIWVGRAALVAIAWGALGVISFGGHYLAPPFSAAARAPGERRDPVLDEATTRFVADAFALAGDTAMAPLAIPDPEFTTRRAAALRNLPVWDPFAVTVILNRTAQPRAFDRFFDATLSLHRHAGGATPLFLAVREVDVQAAEERERGMTWERRHGRPYAMAAGAVAVHASRVSEEGLLEYVPDLARPESTTATPTELTLAVPDVWFAPATGDFAVAAAEDGPFAGIQAGGLVRRLALSWTLQSPSILTSADVGPDSYVLSDRAVGARLARFAPFARFGAAYPVVAGGALWWIAPGYVWSEAYPLSVSSRWRGRDVRFLQAGLVGVVNARSGATTVYLSPDADPVSRAWRRLAPDVVRSPDSLPDAVRHALRYPDELFRVQVGLLRRADWRPGSSAGGAARTPEPYWWVGTALVDSVTRLRLRAVIEVQVDARVSTIIDGAMVDGVPQLGVIAYPEPLALTGPSELGQEFASQAVESAAIPGYLKLAPFEDGAIGVQAFYAEPSAAAGPPRLAEVAVGWRGATGRGPTLEAALRRVRVQRPEAPAARDAWDEAREWFRRLDAARASGDWTAFGEAYAALRRLLGRLPDTSSGEPPR